VPSGSVSDSHRTLCHRLTGDSTLSLRLELPLPVRRRLNLRLASKLRSAGGASDQLPTLIERSWFGCPSKLSPACAASGFFRLSRRVTPGLRQKISSGCASGQFPACAVRSGSSALLAIQLLACAANCLLRVCRRCILWLAPLAASSDLPAIPGWACAAIRDPSAHRLLQAPACAETRLSRCAFDSDLWLAPPTQVFWLTSDLRLRLSPESSILQLTGFFNSRLAPKPGSSGVPLMLPLGLRRRLHLLASPVGCFRLSPAAAPWLSGDAAFRLSSEPASSGCADHSRSTFNAGPEPQLNLADPSVFSGSVALRVAPPD